MAASLAAIKGARQPQDQTGATERAGLQSCCAAVQFGLLGHQRQTEAGSPTGGRRSAGEALEHGLALLSAPGAIVVHDDLHAGRRTVGREQDTGGPAV